ncbi:WAP four-disulfide core domain protein 3-like [Haliotis rufescens]|uniref:WAP four-disulfide core domain protein 3-like n=1 Tax=Haliotis rufescens TaxID=6454 RepID=UPI00201F6C6F|nr:WAP four-disulfide core domain protein 3-like [Haliotis rufescens]
MDAQRRVSQADGMLPLCLCGIQMLVLLPAYVHADVTGNAHGVCEGKLCPWGKVCRVRTMCPFVPPCFEIGECVRQNKPGACARRMLAAGACLTTCDTDADCRLDLKCCGRCPRTCTAPTAGVDVPGTCPRIPQCPDTLPFCPLEPLCLSDSDCPGFKKCCGRCPRLCITAVH